jgi:hypothetical protein
MKVKSQNTVNQSKLNRGSTVFAQSEQHFNIVILKIGHVGYNAGTIKEFFG